MDENQVAASNQGTEEKPNTTDQPAEPQEQAPIADIPADKIEAFNKFIKGQGGFNNAFGKWQEMISQPEKFAPAQKSEPAGQKPAEQPQAPVNKEVPKGFITYEEHMIRDYYNSLAKEEKYKCIADDITSGNVISEMKEFGIVSTKDGMINDSQIRKFLDLKAQTVPAKSTTTPITTTPTVDYVNVGEEIKSIDDARAVIAQNRTLNGQEHPMTAKAKEYIKQYFSTKK